VSWVEELENSEREQVSVFRFCEDSELLTPDTRNLRPKGEIP